MWTIIYHPTTPPRNNFTGVLRLILYRIHLLLTEKLCTALLINIIYEPCDITDSGSVVMNASRVNFYIFIILKMVILERRLRGFVNFRTLLNFDVTNWMDYKKKKPV